jgi:phenylpyruvate tautomerase PptA (4-oxalocrotonate tautomerase family)
MAGDTSFPAFYLRFPGRRRSILDIVARALPSLGHMPLVSIVQAPRDAATTRRLVTAITESVAEICRVPPERVLVHLQDVDGEHWAEGGVLAGDRKKAAAAK